MSEGGEAAGPHPAVHALLNDHSNKWWRRRRAIQIPDRRVNREGDDL
jgi:hypothetical protein